MVSAPIPIPTTQPSKNNIDNLPNPPPAGSPTASSSRDALTPRRERPKLPKLITNFDPPKGSKTPALLTPSSPTATSDKWDEQFSDSEQHRQPNRQFPPEPCSFTVRVEKSINITPATPSPSSPTSLSLIKTETDDRDSRERSPSRALRRVQAAEAERVARPPIFPKWRAERVYTPRSPQQLHEERGPGPAATSSKRPGQSWAEYGTMPSRPVPGEMPGAGGGISDGRPRRTSGEGSGHTPLLIPRLARQTPDDVESNDGARDDDCAEEAWTDDEFRSLIVFLLCFLVGVFMIDSWILIWYLNNAKRWFDGVAVMLGLVAAASGAGAVGFGIWIMRSGGTEC